MLVRNTLNLPVIICEQGNAPKVIPTEEAIINSNINGFGDDIGKITNRITAMFDVQSQYDEDSEEYQVLDYRIQAGQLLQQNSIDRIKGIVSNPMPKEWYSREAVYKMPEDTEEQRTKKELYLRIVADRKPYFQRYIYNDIMRQYNTFIKNTRGNCISRFRMTPQELMLKTDHSFDEAEFLRWYFIKMPLGIHDCLTNRICRRVENEFDGYVSKNPIEVPYDYGKLIRGDGQITGSVQSAVKKEYNAYGDWLARASKYFVEDPNTQIVESKGAVLRITEQQILMKCPDIESACDVALNLCVKHRKYIGFLWDVFGDVIINRMLQMSGGVIEVPMRSDNGDVVFCGERFSVIEVTLGENEYKFDFE